MFECGHTQHESALDETDGRFTLDSIDDMLKLPDPEFLIDGIIEVGALGLLFGAPGSAKSLLALDWAMSIATGRSWQSHGVRQGPVVYVAAEAARGVPKRIRAWLKQRDVNDWSNCPIYFLRVSVQLREKRDVGDLLATLQKKKLVPRLIIIDTLARCFLGGEENSAKEIGEFIHGAEALSQETGATVLVLHHTGKNQDLEERGSSALQGAADTRIHIKKSGTDLNVGCRKQKEAADFETIALRLETINLDADQNQKAGTSVVLVSGSAEKPTGFDAKDEKLLAALAGAGKPLKAGEWQHALTQAGDSMPEKTFYTRVKHLMETGSVVQDCKGGHYSLGGNKLDPATALPKAAAGIAQSSAATPPTL